ncbi:uncharacterized protein B0H18DRAFT_530899 [Fomitopsis serialis]|uniref:uncharacterized protein n=1 Tax=Fomitopsis serialis TaxID=139415 RepID=UPI0020079342|nr:uncharacterized protein B0H18DRAFT_530899 [Neoantrodia serialis]KAH9921848.1 hypothetical protein B0H18DRAFT_530899 [Neoantrodia serialis]
MKSNPLGYAVCQRTSPRRSTQQVFDSHRSTMISHDFTRSATIIVVLCNILADLIVIIVTWVHMSGLIRLQGWRHWQSSTRSIVWLLFRDGTFYFVAVFSVNLLVFIAGVCFHVLNIDYLASLDTPLQSVLMYRFLINLRETSDRAYIGSQSTSGDIDRLPNTTIEASSLRFEQVHTVNSEQATGSSGEQLDVDGANADDITGCSSTA